MGVLLGFLLKMKTVKKVVKKTAKKKLKMSKKTKKSEDILINTKKLNQAQIASLFGLSRETIRDWVKKGCPNYKDTGLGTPIVYDLGSVIRWRMDWLTKKHEVTDIDGLSIERLKEQIKKLQLENAEREKKTVTKERFEQVQRKQALELMGFFTSGYKRNAQRMMKELELPATKLVDFLEIWDAYMKEALDIFVSSGKDIE